MNGRARFHGIGVALAGVILGVLAGVGGRAQANDDATKLRAQTLFVDGRKEIDKGDFAAGCPKVRESLLLFTVANSLFTVAQCDEHEGKIAAAFDHWERGLALVDAKDPRAKVAKDRMESLDPRVPRIRVVAPSAPVAVSVLLDGAELSPANLATFVRVEPGKHVFVVRAPGREDTTREFTLAERERTEFVGTLGAPITSTPVASASAAKPPPTDTGAPPPPPPPPSHQRTVGYIVGGVGVLGLVAGGVTSVGVYGADADLAAFDKSCVEAICNWPARPEMVNQYKTLLSVNAVAYGVGMAGIAAGVVILLTSPRTKPTNAALVPLTVDRGYGIGVIGRF